MRSEALGFGDAANAACTLVPAAAKAALLQDLPQGKGLHCDDIIRLCWGYIGVILGLYYKVILGLYRGYIGVIL